MTTMNVFTYGSLMYPRIWSNVVSGHYASCAAVLGGFRRCRVKGEVFPGIAPGDGEVRGVLYFNVAAHDLMLLDAFEGHYYRRDTGIVNLSEGIPLISAFYVFADEYSHLLSDEEWDPDEFAVCGMEQFITDWMEPRVSNGGSVQGKILSPSAEFLSSVPV